MILALALSWTCAATSPQDATPFPPATPVEVGLDPARVEALDATVARLAADGDVVGGELLLIKDGRTVLHTAHGWRDRDASQALEPGSVFCVRSMTKPFIGAAVRMLEADGRIEFDDPIAKYLPEFDVDDKRAITIDQLLHHTSGLPMSHLVGQDVHAFAGVREVAALGAARELESEPGTKFEYSDQGTDTLTALIEAVTDAPADEFVRTRLLEPLGMGDSACVLPEGHALRERAVSKYTGAPGAWMRYWKPDDRELFPFFLGSQAMYSTTTDYARFMSMWLDKGRVGRERLLRPRAVRKTLEPGPYPMNGACGFGDVEVEYGSLMMLYLQESEGERELVGFGHNGSDGTHAWAFPEHDAIVLYFTQSRGTRSGGIVEAALGDLFFGTPFDPLQAAPPLDEFIGFYVDGPNDRYRAVVRDGDRLAIEKLGRGIVPLQFLGDDRWRPATGGNEVIEFDRDESGRVAGWHVGEHREFLLEPSEDLPSVDEVVGKVVEAHGFANVTGLGVVHIESTTRFEKLGIEAHAKSWLTAPALFRMEETARGQTEHYSFDGVAVQRRAGDTGVTTLEGEVAASIRLSTPFVRFGDWRAHFDRVTVIQTLVQGDRTVIVVRLGDASAPAATVYVDAETGIVGRVDEVTALPGTGRVGRIMEFHDFRSVGGVMLPHRTEIEIANPLVGPVVSTIDKVEVGVEVPDGWFRLD